MGLKPPKVLGEYWRTYLKGIKVVSTLLSRYPEDDPIDFDLIDGETEYKAMVPHWMLLRTDYHVRHAATYQAASNIGSTGHFYNVNCYPQRTIG